MAVSPARSLQPNRSVSVLKSIPGRSQTSALDHAVRLIYRVCCLAGSADLIEQIRNENGGAAVRSAIRRHDTATLYDWLMSALSYQGISDRVAYEYMERHGQATWSDLESKLARPVSCPKLKSYWHFHDCRYDKTSRTCAEPCHIDRCPLPGHKLRNGRLNQTAYSLCLFIRDIADGDLVGWIDSRLKDADDPTVADRLGRMREALIEPLRQVYGVADKVLTMALSCILLAAPKDRPRWIEVGGSMIAIDTLVHNFLHRTGILRRLMLTIPMALPATRQAAAPTSSPWWPSRSMPGLSIHTFRPSFRGSSSTQFGGTALNPASTSATAIASMIASHAQIYTVGCTVLVIVFIQ